MTTASIVKVPRRTLLVLCGPAGSGKSTFAAQRFPSTNIVSSDHCRAMICDDENNQQVNRDTFELFHLIIQKRLSLGHFEEQVIPYHTGLLQRAILDAPREGWEQIHVLGEQDMNAIVEIEDI